MKLLNSIMLVALSLIMSSCNIDEIIHNNMLKKTKWENVQNNSCSHGNGNTSTEIKTLLFYFETATKGELTITTVTSSETREEKAPFDYTFTDSMISGSITVKEGEYSGKYNVAYSRCDETLILYFDEVSMVLYKVE